MDMGRQQNLLGKDVNGHDQDLTELVDGAVPSSLMVRVKEIYREVERVDTWSKWYGSTTAFRSKSLSCDAVVIGTAIWSWRTWRLRAQMSTVWPTCWCEHVFW